MNVVEAFERWLQTEGYQPSTVAAYGKAFAAFSRRSELPANALYASTARALLRWPDAGQAPETVAAAKRWLDDYEAQQREPKNRTQARRAAQGRRKREAKSIDDATFTRLAEYTWQQSDITPSAAVLALLYATGLRIGDALRVTRDAVQKGPERGTVRLTAKGGDDRLLPWDGAPEEWARLRAWFHEQDASIRTVADLVIGKPDASTEASGAAYQRVATLFRGYATTLGITERVHLHRIRRTVGVRALDVTKDLAAVQQMLGHKSIVTTARYADEARPEALAGIQQTIHPRKNQQK